MGAYWGGSAENEDLVLLVGRADNPLSTQAAKALAMVRSLQSTLFTEREGFAVREAGLTTRVWGLETAVTDSLRDLLRERRVREEVEWQVWPRGRDKEESMLDEIECRVCKVRQKQEEQGVVGRAEREQAQRREEEVQRREEEDSRRRREETLRRRGEDELKVCCPLSRRRWINYWLTRIENPGCRRGEDGGRE